MYVGYAVPCDSLGKRLGPALCPSLLVPMYMCVKPSAYGKCMCLVSRAASYTHTYSIAAPDWLAKGPSK